MISPASYNGPVGLALFCPITGQAKGYPFEVPLPTGLAMSGVVLADHVKYPDWRARRAEYAGAAPDAVVAEVVRRLGLLIGGGPDGRIECWPRPNPHVGFRRLMTSRVGRAERSCL